MADKFSKSLYLKKAFTEKGEKFVDGDIEIFLHKPYGEQTVTSVRDVPSAKGLMTVCNCEGSIKVDEMIQKQLKYFFDTDIPVGGFINIKVGVWGTWGRAFAKFRFAEGDKCIFFLNSIKLESFTRKNGETGYELRAHARDFKQTYSKRNEDGSRAESCEASMAATAPATHQAVTNTTQEAALNPSDDFLAIDDSEDLPF